MLIDHRLEIRQMVEWGYSSYWHKHRLRAILSDAQGQVCAICGKSIGRWTRNLDHVWPIALGGFNGPGNMVVSHEWCNTIKSNSPPTGCEIIWLVVVCARLEIPLRLKK